jgi:hypothetical protein
VIALVADEGLEVELQAGEEDRVQHPDAADRLQAGEPREQVEHVRPDDRAERQQSQEPREARTLGDERSEHDDEPDDGEPERRGRLHRLPVHDAPLEPRRARSPAASSSVTPASVSRVAAEFDQEGARQASRSCGDGPAR